MGEFKTYFTRPKIEILALASGRVPILFTVSTHLLVYSTITVDTNAV
jgi:hypothetical protein